MIIVFIYDNCFHLEISKFQTGIWLVSKLKRKGTLNMNVRTPVKSSSIYQSMSEIPGVKIPGVSDKISQ